jgi:DNA repair exonuclease SbcCD nuclease subunit
MTVLLTSDLHLSDRPQDEYRFGLFKWLAKMQKAHNTTATFILGDITEKKDKHSSVLVNRLVDELIGLRPPVYILKGNHDFIDPNNPFFRFLNCIQGVEFITEPTYLPDHNVTLIPHQPNQAKFDEACGLFSPGSFVMVHQTFDGAKSETNAHLSGLRASAIEVLKPLGTYAGDVHKPQRCGPVTYVGAPYTVRFGDDFTPRVLLLKGKSEQNLYFDCPRKWSLTIRSEDDLQRNEDLRQGDQIRLTVELAREEAVEWAAYKKRVLDTCHKLGLEVYETRMKVLTLRKERAKANGGVKIKSNEELIQDFCVAEGTASNIKKVGLKLVRNQEGGTS